MGGLGRFLDNIGHRAPLALAQGRSGLSAWGPSLEARRIIGGWMTLLQATRGRTRHRSGRTPAEVHGKSVVDVSQIIQPPPNFRAQHEGTLV